MKDWAWVWGLVGVLGVIAGFLAFWKARSSDAAAKLSLKAAQESVTIAKRTEERETEAHFVDWAGIWKGPGVFMLHNTGDDTANDVKLVLYIDYQPYNFYVETLDGDEATDIDVPKALQLWEQGRDDLAARRWNRKQERIEAAAQRRAGKDATGAAKTMSALAGFGMDSRHRTEEMFDHKVGLYDVRYRVFWRTDLGTPKDSDYRKHGDELLGPAYGDTDE
ncbi:MAG: hypothetical protein NVV57_10765 [Demequina sp.]|jgi:hypothetical protein|nr:hypothetical protein [Demequina sp.]